MNSDKELYELARKRVERKKKFYKHLNTYLVMTIFFVLLNMFTSPGRWWFIFPVLGWGIGIALEYLNIFGLPGIQPDAEWEKKALEEELRKMNPPNEKPVNPVPEQEDTLELKELKKNYDDKDLV
jgi:hypothetical protein